MSKPKEWWICQTPGYDGDAYDTDPRTWPNPKGRVPIHVIEKSAYEAVIKERDALIRAGRTMNIHRATLEVAYARSIEVLQQVQMLFHSEVDLPGTTQDMIHDAVDKVLADLASSAEDKE